MLLKWNRILKAQIHNIVNSCGVLVYVLGFLNAVLTWRETTKGYFGLIIRTVRDAELKRNSFLCLFK